MLHEHTEQVVLGVEAMHARMAMDSPRRSPRTPAPSYVPVVRNTFIEVHDNQDEANPEEFSQPLFRRRRGSSFWRCSSEPLRVPRVEHGAPGLEDDQFHSSPASSQHDSAEDTSNVELWEVEHTDLEEQNKLKSRRDSKDIAYVATEFDWKSSRRTIAGLTSPSVVPQLPPGSFNLPQTEPALAAAIQAGFSAGVMAAMQLQGSGGIGNSVPPMSGRMSLPSRQSLSTLSVSSHENSESYLGYVRGRQFEHEGKIRSMTPPGHHSSNISEASTAIGSAASRSAPSPVPCATPKNLCHLIWCDSRAFKEAAAPQRRQLELETNLTVKAHKSAENCIRLLRKKQNAQGRPPCVILVSWTNAGALLPFLNEAAHVVVKVVVLRDSHGNRKQDDVEQLLHRYPFVESIVSSWSDAVHAVGVAAAELQVSQW